MTLLRRDPRLRRGLGSPSDAAVVMMRLPQVIAFATLLTLGSTAHPHPGGHETIEHFSRHVRAQPNDQALRIQRGIAYSNEGEYELALADFRKAEALGDPMAVAFDLGVLHYRMRDFEAARRDFDALLARNPGHAATLEYRARLRRDAGDAAGAVADYRRHFASAARPDPGSYAAAAALLARIPDEGPGSALQLLDEGLSRLGVLPPLQRQAIGLELGRGRPDLAIERQRTLERVLHGSPEWCVEMGELLLRADRRTEASEYFARAERALSALRPTPARTELRDRVSAGQRTSGADH